MEFILSCGGRIFLNYHFTVHPSLVANMIAGYKWKLNTYNPSVLAAYNEKYFLGLSYKDLNKITIRAGASLFGYLMLNAECAYGIKKDINYFGSPVYLGGNIRVLINNNHKKTAK